MSELLCGKNPVEEALKAGLAFERILIGRDLKKAQLTTLISLARRNKTKIELVSRQRLSELAEKENPRGVIGIVQQKSYADLQDILDFAAAKRETPFLALLDGIQDPQNLGAIIRTADGAGVHGVVIPRRRAAGLTGTVAKTSAGASAHVAVAQVSNLSYAIERLQQHNIWFVGADQDAESNYTEVDLTGAIGVVIGSEGEGLHRLVKEKCDFLVRIPMYGNVNSLNASVAAAVLFFEIRRQRNLKK